MNYFVLLYRGKCYDTIDIEFGRVIGCLKIMTNQNKTNIWL